MSNFTRFSKNSNSSALYRASLAPMSRDEECSLAVKARNGDKKAREKLFRANLRYAIKLANTYIGVGLDADDLYSEAAYGLLNAVDHFDSERGTVCTCAFLYIRNAIFNAANKCGKHLRLSDADNKKLVQIKKAQKEIECHFGSADEQIAALSDSTGIPQDTIEDLLRCSENSVSGSANVGEDGAELFDLLKDNRSSSPEENAIAACMREDLLNELPKMEKYERYVFMLANGFGYKNASPHTLSDIGKRFGHSKQWANWKLKQANMHLAEKMREWA